MRITAASSHLRLVVLPAFINIAVPQLLSKTDCHLMNRLQGRFLVQPDTGGWVWGWWWGVRCHLMPKHVCVCVCVCVRVCVCVILKWMGTYPVINAVLRLCDFPHLRNNDRILQFPRLCDNGGQLIKLHYHIFIRRLAIGDARVHDHFQRVENLLRTQAPSRKLVKVDRARSICVHLWPHSIDFSVGVFPT